MEQNARVNAVVQSLGTLLEGNEREQRETFEYLKQTLDEDRPSNRSRRTKVRVTPEIFEGSRGNHGSH